MGLIGGVKKLAKWYSTDPRELNRESDIQRNIENAARNQQTWQSENPGKPLPPGYVSPKFGSGGGGGSSGSSLSSSISQAQAEAERKRLAEEKRIQQEELQKKLDEAKRLNEELKKQRQEKAFGGTISGQIQKNKNNITGEPSVIKPFSSLESSSPPPSKSELGVKESFVGRVKNYVGGGLRNLFNERTGEDLSREIRGDNGLFVGGNLASGIMVSNIPTGTVVDQTLFPTKVSFEQRAGQEAILGGGAGTPAEFIVQDIERNVTNKAQSNLDKETKNIQNQINRGDITLEEANIKLQKKQEEINKKAEEEFQKELKTNEKLRRKGISEGTLSILSQTQKGLDISPLVETGALVGGSLVAPVATGVIVGGLGAREFTLGVGKGILGEDLTLKQRGLELGKATVGLAIAGAGVYGASTALGNQITRLDIENTLSKRTQIYGKEVVKTKKGSLFNVAGKKQGAGESKLLIKEKLPVFNTGEEAVYGTTESGSKVLLKEGSQGFSITGGTGTSKLTYYDFNKGEYVTKGIDFSIFGRGSAGGNPILYGKQGGYNVERTLKDFQSAYGKGGIIQEGEITSFNFGGAVKKQDDVYQILGGSVKRGRINVGTGKKSVLFNIESSGIIEAYKPTTQGFDISVITSKAGGGSSLLSQTQQVTIQPSAITSLIEKGGEATITTLLPKQSTSFVGGVSNLVKSGTGKNPLLTKQSTILKTERFSPLVSNALIPQFVEIARTGIRTKTKNRSILGTSSLGRTDVLSPSKTTSLFQSNQTPQLKQKSIQRQIQKTGLAIPTLSPVVPYGLSNTFGFPGLNFPPLPSFTGRQTRRKSQRRKQRTAYQPSFTATILNIRARKTPLYGGGFQIRPIIISKKRKPLKKEKGLVLINHKGKKIKLFDDLAEMYQSSH